MRPSIDGDPHVASHDRKLPQGHLVSCLDAAAALLRSCKPRGHLGFRHHIGNKGGRLKGVEGKRRPRIAVHAHGCRIDRQVEACE